VAGGSARRPIGPGLRRSPPHLAVRTVRDRRHGRDQALPAPDRVLPADDAKDGARLGEARREHETGSAPLEDEGVSTMRQLTCTASHELEWRDVPEPRLASDTDALVRPLAVARCDIDLILMSGLVPLRGPF